MTDAEMDAAASDALAPAKGMLSTGQITALRAQLIGSWVARRSGDEARADELLDKFNNDLIVALQTLTPPRVN